MTVSVNIQNITGVMSAELPAGGLHTAFDTVKISDRNGSYVSLFLPAGTGAEVARAINAALAAAEPAKDDAA